MNEPEIPHVFFLVKIWHLRYPQCNSLQKAVWEIRCVMLVVANVASSS